MHRTMAAPGRDAVAESAHRCGLLPPASGAAFEFVAALLDADAESLAESSALLSGDERQRAGRFAFERERLRFTVARACLRRLLGERLGVAPQSLQLAYGAHGKPALAGRHAAADLRFNVSHSGDIAVYAFAIGREIGVDVEAVRGLSDADELAARFFSPREQAAYRVLEARDKPQGFFNCWTRKEAFVKALGAGLSHPLARFDVTLAPGDPARILRVDDADGERCGWQLNSFVPRPGFVAAVVTQDRCL